MDLYKPNVSEDLAKSLVKELYGLEVVSIKKMVSFDDQNFHITISENHKNPYISNIVQAGYTLKITNTKKSSVPGHYDSMHATMIHLNKRGVRAPMPLKNLKGETWSLEKVPLLNEDSNINEPMLCGVHILSFISGSTVSTVECTKNLLYQWGAFLAKYHNATQDFSHPALKGNVEFWNMEHIPELKDYMDGLSEERKELVQGVLDRFPTEVEANYNQLPRGIIHGDFNMDNVLVQIEVSPSGEKIVSVDGILDFEDCHDGTYLWDVAVMMAYVLLQYNAENVLDAPGHALSGYLSVRPLSSLELNLLKIGMESRLCQTLVLCAHSFQQDPQNVYLLSSAKTGWAKLGLMTSVTNEELLSKWNTIRQSYKIK